MLHTHKALIIPILVILLSTSFLPGLPPEAQTPDTPDLSLDTVEEAMTRAQEYLLAVRNEDGYWDGKCLFHTDSEPDLMGLTATYVLFLSRVGMNNPGRRRAVDYLIASQRPDGSWGTNPTATYLATWALREAGISPTSTTLQKAHDYLHQRDESLEDTGSYALYFYALAGEYPWQELDHAPHLDDTAEFSEGKPNAYSMPIALSCAILSTLDTEEMLSREQRRLLRRAESLLLQQQWPDGSWFGSETQTIFALTALYELGYEKNDEFFVQGLRFLGSLQFEDGSMAMFKLPIWDTSLALVALETSGVSQDRREVQRAVQWLVDSRNLTGGWAYTPGGVADVDDTAFPAVALLEHEPDVVDEAVSFLFSRQNRDGGWATFSRDHSDRHLYLKWIPDSSEILFFEDPSIPDGTAHALLALGRAGYTIEDERVQRAVSYLQRVQFDNGMWFGWWGIPYIYGSSGVLMGLKAVGADMESPYVQKAVEWLKNCQNADGGWGEDFEATQGPESGNAGKGNSTTSQTAWAILGLLAAHVPPDSEVIESGISYLISHQKDDGSWEPAHTMLATFPYPYSMEHAEVSWPLWALSSYKSAIQGSGGETEGPAYRIVALPAVLVVALLLLGVYVVVRRNLLRKPGP